MNILKGYWSWLKYYFYKPYRDKRRKEAIERILICENCEHFTITRQCSLCLCFMDVKTKMYFELDENEKSIDGCWIKKW